MGLRRHRAALLGRPLQRAEGPDATPAIARGATTCSAKYGLKCWAISNHLIGQLVLDHNDARTDDWVPAAVRGDAKKKTEWAIQEMKDTARAAQKLGVKVVNGFTGSSIWHLLYSFPPVSDAMIDDGFKLFAERWNPILDVFKECGVKFGLEVHPTEIAFDIYSAERALEGARPPPRVRLQLRPQPPALADGRPRRVHPGASRTGSITSTSRTPPGRSTASRASWPRTSTSAIPAAAGTSARRAADRSTSRRSPGPSTTSATTARSRSSGKTAAWIASTAPPRPPASSRTRWASSPPAGSSIRPSPRPRPSRNFASSLSDRA